MRCVATRLEVKKLSFLRSAEAEPLHKVNPKQAKRSFASYRDSGQWTKSKSEPTISKR